MPKTISFMPSDIAGLREKAELAEKLLASGAISEAELEQLLEQYWAEQQVDDVAHTRRARFATTADHHIYIGEKTMNANDIVNQIEQTRSVMSAQLRKLSECSPAPFAMAAVNKGGESGLVDVLHATVAGHVINAANSLRAIAEVEAALRTSTSKTTAAEPDASPRSPQVIDAEFREVK